MGNRQGRIQLDRGFEPPDRAGDVARIEERHTARDGVLGLGPARGHSREGKTICLAASVDRFGRSTLARIDV